MNPESILIVETAENLPLPVIDEIKRGRKTKRFVRNLLERLKEWKESVMRFIDDPLVPFDNNQGGTRYSYDEGYLALT